MADTLTTDQVYQNLRAQLNGAEARLTAKINHVTDLLAQGAEVGITVGSITLSPNSFAVPALSTQQITATVRDTLGAVVTAVPVLWVSGTPTVATVSPTGLVTGVGVGTCVITASATSNNVTVQATATVTVTAAVGTVTLSPTPFSINGSSTQQLTPVVKDTLGNVMSPAPTGSWFSANGAIAQVSATGLVSGTGPGTTTISYVVAGVTGVATVTVNQVVGSVSVSPQGPTLTVGAVQAMLAVVRDTWGGTMTGQAITWSTSNSAVVSIDSASGLATAVATGSATITATATSNGTTGTSTVNVAGALGTFAYNANGITIAYPRTRIDEAVFSESAALASTTSSVTVTYGTNTATNAVNVQAAINSAAALDVGTEIVLNHGGNGCNQVFNQPRAPTATGWVVIRSTNSGSLPPTSTRATGARPRVNKTHGSLLAKFVTQTGGAETAIGVSTKSGTSVAHHYAYIGCWATHGASTDITTLVSLRDENLNSAYVTPDLPHHFIWSRCLISGDNVKNTRIGIWPDCNYFLCADGTITDCHQDGNEARAHILSDCDGIQLYRNMEMGGTGQDFFLAGTGVRPNVTPSDIEVAFIHFYKPEIWNKWDTAVFALNPLPDVKTKFECKNGAYVWMYGCIFDGCWGDGQDAYPDLRKNVAQNGNNTWNATHNHVTEYCKYKRVPKWINLSQNPEAGGGQGTTTVLHSLLFRHILVEPQSELMPFAEPIPVGIQVGADSASVGVMDQLVIQHVTELIGGGTLLNVANATISDSAVTNAVLEDIVALNGLYGVRGNDWAAENAFTHYFPGCVPKNWTIIGSGPFGAPAVAFLTPLDYTVAGFADYPNGNFAFTSASASHNSATDGTDRGCDIATLNAKIANVDQIVHTVRTLKLSTNSLPLSGPGSTAQLSVKVYDQDLGRMWGLGANYSSSDTSVATVDAVTGVVTAVAVGNCVITAANGAGSDTCTVTVGGGGGGGGGPIVGLTANFTGADSSTVLVPPDSGQPWIFYGGGVWGTSGQQAYTPTPASYAVAVAETNLANGTLTLVVPTIGNGGAAFRFSDANNGYFVTITPTRYTLLQLAGGSLTTYQVSTGAPTPGATVQVVLGPGTLEVRENGVTVLGPHGATFNQSATQHGLVSNNNTTGRYDSVTFA